MPMPAHTVFRSLLLSCAAATALGAPAALAQPATEPQSASATNDDAAGEAPGQSGDIVVTAQRRSENLRNVPISISVLGGAKLDSGADASINDAITKSPGVYSFNSGQNGGTKFAIRGVTGNTSIYSGASTVGYYLDEVPFGFVRFPHSPDANAYDMERVEVLRGPQGTLYGIGSLNGVIRVITHGVDLDHVEGKARGMISSTESGGENYRADGVVNVPLIEGKLGVRLAAGYSDYSGWLDSPMQNKEDVNGAKNTTVRFKVAAAPSDDTKIELTYWRNRTHIRGISVSADGRNTPDTAIDQPTDNDYDVYAAAIDHDFGFAALTSSTSYIKFDSNGILWNGESNDDYYNTRYGSKLFSQEVRLHSDSASSLEWTVGGIYRNAADYQITDVGVGTPDFTGAQRGANYYSSSFAVFGETKYKLSPSFDIAGGIRYFQDHQKVRETFRSFVVPTDPVKAEATYHAWTPRFVLTWRPTERVNLYASYSQGFRSGFIQSPSVLFVGGEDMPDVKPDRLTNYEVGLKGTVPDVGISYELSVYYIHWKDSQQQVFKRISSVGNVDVALPFNGPAINGPGVDASISYRVTSDLTASLSGSYNDLKFSSDVVANFSTGDVVIFPKGERPDDSPAATLGGALDYRADIGSNLELNLAASVAYVSKAAAHSKTGVKTEGDDFTNVGLRAGLDIGQRWKASIYAENLLNQNPVLRAYPGDPTFNSRIRPRTIGAQIELSF